MLCNWPCGLMDKALVFGTKRSRVRVLTLLLLSLLTLRFIYFQVVSCIAMYFHVLSVTMREKRDSPWKYIKNMSSNVDSNITNNVNINANSKSNSKSEFESWHLKVSKTECYRCIPSHVSPFCVHLPIRARHSNSNSNSNNFELICWQ